MSRARERTDLVRSRVAVRVANPAALTRPIAVAILTTPLASNPESVGYATSASTTVVSARTRLILSTLAAAALVNNASLSPSTASTPHRVVIFINVVGCGTDDPNGIRANRCQLIESVTSRHTASKPSRYRYLRNINRRYVSIGIDGRPIVAWKNARYGSKNRSSSNSRSTASSSAGSPSTSTGSTASHNVGCSPTVRNIDGSDP